MHLRLRLSLTSVFRSSPNFRNRIRMLSQKCTILYDKFSYLLIKGLGTLYICQYTNKCNIKDNYCENVNFKIYSPLKSTIFTCVWRKVTCILPRIFFFYLKWVAVFTFRAIPTRILCKKTHRFVCLKWNSCTYASFFKKKRGGAPIYRYYLEKRGP